MLYKIHTFHSAALVETKSKLATLQKLGVADASKVTLIKYSSTPSDPLPSAITKEIMLDTVSPPEPWRSFLESAGALVVHFQGAPPTLTCVSVNFFMYCLKVNHSCAFVSWSWIPSTC